MKGRNNLVASAAYRPEPAAVAAARKFVRETLQSWLETRPGPADAGLVDDAVLLTSELVTNAVVHAGTQVHVTCKLAASAVEVVVRDSHPARMVPGPARDENVPAERTSGRGLLLPSALASTWGVSYGADAKAVWFRMGLSGRRAAAAEPGADPDAPVTAAPAERWNVRADRPGAAGGPAGRHPAQPAGEPGYDELLQQAVASARVIVAADAAYALVADEDGALSVRAAAGIGPAALLRTAPSVTTAPFIMDGRVTGALAVAAVLPGRFGDNDVQRLQQLADSVTPALERARLAELERARRARIAVLAEASALLAGPLGQDEILAIAGEVAVPRLAAWCAVLVTGPGGDLQPAAVRHIDECQSEVLAWLLDSACQQGAHTLAQRGPGTGVPQCWPLTDLLPAGAPTAAADLAARGAWCFPLVTRGGTLGLLALGGPHAGRPSREVLSLAEDLAGRIALALENSRLIAQQHAAGQAVRAALVPAELPAVPGVELAVAHDLPGPGAGSSGGDFCDVFPAGDGTWRFAIGEVCGTGPATLTVAALARNTLRILGREGLSVPDVLARLNQLILDERLPGTYLTLVHGEIRPAGDEAGPAGAAISLACAGQPLPLVLRAPRRRAAAPQSVATPQPVLGVIEGLGFTAQPVTLRPADLLLCVTDGVTRRRDGNRQLDDDDGLARLLAGCAGLTADVVAVKVHEEVRGFGGHPPMDGMAVLALRASS